MACGCPVFTTEAVPYAVDGENAVVCKVEDVKDINIKEGVLKIFQDKDLANKIREGGFRRDTLPISVRSLVFHTPCQLSSGTVDSPLSSMRA